MPIETTKLPARFAETRLEKHVLRWVNRHASDYSDGWKGVRKDLEHGGCSSGYVGELVYTSEAAKFYRSYRADIGAIVANLIDDCEWSPTSIDQWDKSDPFANSDGNQNLLAWLGFEEAARAIFDRADAEV